MHRCYKVQAACSPNHTSAQDSTLSFAADAFESPVASAPLAEGGDDGQGLRVSYSC